MNINSTNPPLPPALGGSFPRPSNGMAEGMGNGSGSAIAAILKAMASAGGINPGGNSRGPRGPEKPSVARANAITRRLNGRPSRGTELKGL